MSENAVRQHRRKPLIGTEPARRRGGRQRSPFRSIPRTCGNKACRKEFLPRHRWQTCCCAECGKASRQAKMTLAMGKRRG